MLRRSIVFLTVLLVASAAQCAARCAAVPCQAADSTHLPPCHRHGTPAPHRHVDAACPGPALLANAPAAPAIALPPAAVFTLIPSLARAASLAPSPPPPSRAPAALPLRI